MRGKFKRYAKKKMEGKKPVFYMYDERMLKHKQFVKPEEGGSRVNPEIPDRVIRIHQHLKETGYLAQMDKLEVQGLDEIETLLKRIHSEDLINLVKSSCEKLGEGESSQACNPGQGEIYECKDSYEAALVSAASAVTAVREILDGDDSTHERGYCIIRPPGHHAYHNVAAGFCFFNNAALAA
jgi:histone deacetylase 6